MDALQNNPDIKPSAGGEEENLDKLIQEENDRIAQLEEDLRNDGYSEDDIRKIISGGEAEEAASDDKRASGEKEPVDQGGFNWANGEFEKPVLTPEEETPWEKAQRLKREGVVQFGEKSKSKAVMPEEGITPATGGKQAGLFGTQEQENRELFSMRLPGRPEKVVSQLPKKGVVFRTTTNRNIIRKDPDWLAAKKQADRAAAARIANRLWTGDKSKQIADSLRDPKSAVIISVPSTTRRNVLPDALADRIAQDIGATPLHGAELFRALHERESKSIPKSTRWKYPREYELAEGAPIEKLRGREIVVADDIFSSGGSAKHLIFALADNGLQVSNVASYYGDSRLRIDPQTHNALKKALRDAGVKISAKDLDSVLTRKEARDIIWQKLKKVKTDAAREKLTQDLQRLLDRRAPENVRQYQQGQPQRPSKGRNSGYGRPAKGLPSGTVPGPSPQPPRGSVGEGQARQKNGGQAPPASETFTPLPKGKRRSAILKKASKALQVPIRTGKFRVQRGGLKAAGIYKPGPKVIRLAKANDLETTIHRRARTARKPSGLWMRLRNSTRKPHHPYRLSRCGHSKPGYPRGPQVSGITSRSNRYRR